MLRRFLVFTLGLMALFCGTALLQERLPEPYRIFPAFADLIPSNPLRPFASGYADVTEWISSESPSDHDQTAENADEGKNADASKAEESPEAHPSHSDIQRDSATEKQLESQEKTTEGPILDSGKDFQYLESFFHKLQALEQYRDGQSEERAGSDGASEKEAGHPHIVRILHFGDSIMWGDNLSLKMKQLFQSDFGDGGRGLVNIIDSPSSELLEHKNSTRRGFRVLTIPFESFTMPRTPELGFSGGSARPNSPDSVTSHSIPEEKLNSWQSARIILGNPNRMKLKNDAPPESRAGLPGELQKTLPYILNVQTSGAQDRSETFEASVQGYCSLSEIPLDRARTLRLSVAPAQKGEPMPIIDGLFLETGAGVSYSAIIKMGIHLAWMQMAPEEVIICGMRKADPALLVFQYGVNESASLSSNYRGFTRQKYETQLRNYFRIIRKALPSTSVLIVGPFERLRPAAGGPSPSEAQMIVRDVQIQLAREFQFAYFDSYRYLGGEGQMLQMVKNREAINDYTHLTRTGGDRLAQGIYDALITHYLIYSGRTESTSDYSISKDFRDSEQVYSYTPTSVTDVQSSPGAIAFHSMDFAYFLFVVVLGGTLLLRFPTLRLAFLIIASYYFYASWKLWPVTLMLFSTVLDYYCARGIGRAREKNGPAGSGSGRAGLLYLLLSLSGNLGLLFFFKYYDFAAHLINQGLQSGGFETTVPALGLLLPVGISFYTFQTLSYTIDVYRGTLAVERSFLRFSLYVTFFPQLVAGPIVRASEFIPDIKRGIYHFLPSGEDFNYGAFQFLGGLIKKMVADWLAFGLIDRVYESPDMFTAGETLIVFYAYGLQIYGDFSGYTDMALGAARLMGFHLTDNFDRPYQSASISEFWRRWHISLGSWFRDYVYISLGGNRSGVYRNLFITMFLAGLWHGAGLMFVAWGMYHGLFLMIERIPAAIRRRYFPQSTGATNLEKGDVAARGLDVHSDIGQTNGLLWLRRLATLHIVLVGWVLFRSRDLDQFLAFFASLFPANLWAFSHWATPNAEWSYIAVVLIAYVYHLGPVRYRQKLALQWNRLNVAMQIIVAFILLVALFQISVQDVQPFIYFQF